MKTAALLSARMNSRRLPGKALLPIEGQTLIERVFCNLRKIEQLDQIILCTTTSSEDDSLADLAIKHNHKVFRGDPIDVLDRFYLAAYEFNVDIIVRATGDNPLTCPKFARQAIDAQREKEAEFCLTKQMPSGTKVEVITFSALERAHLLTKDRQNTEYMTYLFDQPDIFRVVELTVPENVRRPNYRLTVDTPDDLRLIREIFKRLPDSEERSLAQVIALLDSDTELRSINQHISPREKPDSLKSGNEGTEEKS